MAASERLQQILLSDVRALNDEEKAQLETELLAEDADVGRSWGEEVDLVRIGGDGVARREDIVGHGVGDEQEVEPAGAQERSPPPCRIPSRGGHSHRDAMGIGLIALGTIVFAEGVGKEYVELDLVARSA